MREAGPLTLGNEYLMIQSGKTPTETSHIL